MSWNGILFSPTGGTKNIMKALLSGTEVTYKGYDLTKPTRRAQIEEKGIQFNEEDTVIFCIPVYGGRVPAILVNTLNQIKGNNTPAVFVVVYGNRHYEDALLELKETMEKNGFVGIAAAAFVAEHSYTNKVGTGRPDKDDLAVAFKFGRDVREKLQSPSGIPKDHPLEIPGNNPYKDYPSGATYVPSTGSFCVQCGVCAKLCPAGAIDPQNCMSVDETKCIHCCNCIKICPVHAKKLDAPQAEKIREYLISNCSEIRRDIEIFL